MIKAVKEFPLYDDSGELTYYEVGDIINVSGKRLIEKLILSGKCELYDPREMKSFIDNKIIDDHEKKIIQPTKKKKNRK